MTKTWIVRNGRAVLISVLMMVLIGITITRPAWRDNIGYRQPKQTVPYGHSTVLGGVRWQLMSIKPPDHQELKPYELFADEIENLPPKSRIATYVLKRDKDGKPAGLPPGYAGCESTAVAGKRRWTKTSSAYSVQEWGRHLGYTSYCSPDHQGPMLLALVVPIDVHLTAIDVQFLPDSWNDKKQLSKATDLLVIRFDTD
jgi:hypothetical protein